MENWTHNHMQGVHESHLDYCVAKFKIQQYINDSYV
jgi:hypothetical protein